MESLLIHGQGSYTRETEGELWTEFTEFSRIMRGRREQQIQSQPIPWDQRTIFHNGTFIDGLNFFLLF
jgi:hypothetical protein